MAAVLNRSNARPLRRLQPTVVVLNGPAGVGKTTVGRRLAASARRGVCIHGDDLKVFMVRRDPGQRGITYRVGAALTEAYLRLGFDLVVFEYVFEAPRHVRAFLDRLRARTRILVVTLWAPLPVILVRERRRKGRRPLGRRVAACWRTIAANLPRLGDRVDAARPVAAVVADLRRRIAPGLRDRD